MGEGLFVQGDAGGQEAMTPLRGRVIIRRIDVPKKIGSILVPDTFGDWQRKDHESQGIRARTSHRGRVLQVGPPALTPKLGAEVPHGFGPGDEVVYSYAHNEGAFPCIWDDGEPAEFISQEEVSAVVE
jgi:hypothetical protein